MATLTKQARETIKNWAWGRPPVTIAGYTRHFFPDGKWGGDACGCIDDRCIGYHHDETDDCGCLEPCLDIYVKEALTVPGRQGKKCPQCGLNPIADGYAVCELCAYAPGAQDDSPDGALPVGTWVTVDLSSNLCQDGEIVGVIGAALGGVWEYEVRVRGGDVITTQPTHVRLAALDGPTDTEP